MLYISCKWSFTVSVTTVCSPPPMCVGLVHTDTWILLHQCSRCIGFPRMNTPEFIFSSYWWMCGLFPFFCFSKQWWSVRPCSCLPVHTCVSSSRLSLCREATLPGGSAGDLLLHWSNQVAPKQPGQFAPALVACWERPFATSLFIFGVSRQSFPHSLVSVKWHLVVLICVSLITGDRLFLFLLTVHLFSLNC